MRSDCDLRRWWTVGTVDDPFENGGWRREAA